MMAPLEPEGLLRLPAAINIRPTREHRGKRGSMGASPLEAAASRLLLPSASPKKNDALKLGASRSSSSSSSVSTRATTGASTDAVNTDEERETTDREGSKEGAESPKAAKMAAVQQALLKLYKEKKCSTQVGPAAGLAKTSNRRWSRLQENMGNMKLLWAKEKIKELAFYQQLPRHTQDELLEVVTYSKLPTGTPLFLQGDQPGTDDLGESYIVLSGEVSIFVAPEQKKLDVPANEDSIRRERRSSAASMDSRLSGTLGDDDDDALDMESKSTMRDGSDNEAQEYWGNLVATVQEGTVLGHLALLRQQPRNATCVCSDETEVLVIRKLDFMRVLKGPLESMKDRKGEFLSKHVPGFGKLSATKSEYALHNFHKMAFERDHIFYEQGSVQHERSIFVISKGVVDVSSNGKKVGVLIPGALFGTLERGVVEEFTMSASHQSSVEVYEVQGMDVRKLPLTLRQSLSKHIRQMRLWHQVRAKESGAPPSCTTPSSISSTCGSRPGTSASSRAGAPGVHDTHRKNPVLPRGLVADAPGGAWLAEQPRWKWKESAGWQTSTMRGGTASVAANPRLASLYSTVGKQAPELSQQEGLPQQGLKLSSSLPSLSRPESSGSSYRSGTATTDSHLSSHSSHSSVSSDASSRSRAQATKARAHEVLRRLRQMD